MSQPVEDSFAVWSAAMSAVHLPWSLRRSSAGGVFEASIQNRRLDDLTLVETSYDACSGYRGRAQIAATTGEFLVLIEVLGGREHIAQEAEDTTIGAGQFALWDSTRPVRFVAPAGHSKRSIIVPVEALAEVGALGRLPRSGAFAATGALRLLSSYLEVLARTVTELAPAERSAARRAALELMVGALRRDPGVGGATAVNPALRAAMERYIEQHLTAADVGAATVAKAHGVSERTVNRIFNATGETVGDVVRRRRLAQARHELAATTSTVAEIAHRCGFSDSSHLSRMFKKQYGRPPSDFRAELTPP